MKFCDPTTGKIYRVNGTTVTQYSGLPYFKSHVLCLFGRMTSRTNFKTQKALNSWLKMMGFAL